MWREAEGADLGMKKPELLQGSGASPVQLHSHALAPPAFLSLRHFAQISDSERKGNDSCLGSLHTVVRELRERDSVAVLETWAWIWGDKGNNSDKDDKNRDIEYRPEQGVSLHLFIFSSVSLGVLQFSFYWVCTLCI